MRKVLLSLWLLACSSVAAATNIESAQAHAWSGNVGWLNWRADDTNGAVIGEYVCSGYLYGANVGWINLGDGSPANGIRYANDSASDYGVNRMPDGRLRGYAYSANVGWIQFEDQGNPRVGVVTGRFSGHAYSANIGWINLGHATYFVQSENIRTGSDSDSDGLTDAWELEKTGNLTTFTPGGDADGDTFGDLLEYAANTDPQDAEDYFDIVSQSANTVDSEMTISWKSSSARIYRIQQSDDMASWSDVGVPVAGSNGTTQTTVAFTPPKFYRVKVLLPQAE